MNKHKTTSQKDNIRGLYYDSKKCHICGKIIYGESEKSHRLAKKDCYLKMRKHRQDHEKEEKQKIDPLFEAIRKKRFTRA